MASVGRARSARGSKPPPAEGKRPEDYFEDGSDADRADLRGPVHEGFQAAAKIDRERAAIKPRA